MEAMTAARAGHWDRAYQDGDATRSWFQAEPTQSLRMIEATGARVEDSIIDIGGGSSRLAEELLHRGYSDITVLDVSATALQLARDRLGAASGGVAWICEDLLAWRPERSYAIWHDRAVFHFMVDAAERLEYLHTLNSATNPGSVAVLGCFALDGPER